MSVLVFSAVKLLQGTWKPPNRKEIHRNGEVKQSAREGAYLWKTAGRRAPGGCNTFVFSAILFFHNNVGKPVENKTFSAACYCEKEKAS